jgi:hypothetical protein
LGALAAFQQFKLPPVLPLMLELYGYERLVAGGEADLRAAASRIGENDDVDVGIGKLVDDGIAARLKRCGKRPGETVAATPGAVLDMVSDRNLHG